MTVHSQDRTLIAWLILVVVTVVSWRIGVSHGSGAFQINPAITWSVMLISALKVRLIVRQFMEVGGASVLLRRLADAAITLACMLERANHIQSPGGYLRDLTRRAARGQFSVGPMVMAAARARGVIGAAKTPLPS